MRKAKRFLSALLALLTLLPLFAFVSAIPSFAEEDTVIESRKTPLMGWASWNAFHTSISEDIIYAQAKALVDLGLADLGYTFVNTDDGFQKGRDAEGYVTNNKETFPSGMRALADKIHALGLKAGIYTDGGIKTCASIYAGLTSNTECGLYGNEEKDLRRYFIDWDFDFIKVDWCGGLALKLDRQTQYTKIGNIIKTIENETGKDKLFNVCSASFPGEWVTEVADSWRMSYDITCNFEDILSHIDQAKVLAKYNGPGHVNDLDMMEVGNGLTYDEDKTHFSMWCMMSTPLLLGMDLRSISEETLSIISNSEVIALDQDPLCVQGHLVKSYGDVEVWMKELASGEVALAFLNRSASEQKIIVRLEDLGMCEVAAVRDLWAHRDIPYDNGLYLTLPAHGTDVYRFEYTPGEGMVDTEENDDGSKVTTEVKTENVASVVNLSTFGNFDWLHIAQDLDTMPDGARELSLAYRGASETYTDGNTLYRYRALDNTMVGLGRTGIRLSGENAAAEVTAECDGTERTLNVVIGGYSADVKVTVFAGGKVVFRESFKGEVGKPTSETLKVTYHSDIPTKLVVRWEIEKELNGSAAIAVESAALSVEPQGSASVSPKIEYASNVTRVNYNVYADESSAVCLVAVKDREGTLVGLRTHDTVKGKWTMGADDFTLGAGFVGTAEIYLWKNEVPLCDKQSVKLNSSASSGYFIGPLTARTMLEKGAVLVDVRGKEEYDAGHLDGAIHLDYSEVKEKAATLLPDKDKTYILYCSMAKRSAQALGRLREMGYNAVFTIGSIANFDALPELRCPEERVTASEGDYIDAAVTGAGYDEVSIYVAYGENASFADAKPLESAPVPKCDGFDLTAKVYLVVMGKSFEEKTVKLFVYGDGEMDAYASDLKWSKQTCGWGSVKKDRSSDGNALTLCGKTYKKGIGTHATSEISMTIPDGMGKFLAVAGIDDEASGGQCDFSVIIDGVTVAEKTLTSGKTAIFDVEIPEGAKTLTLYVFEGAGGNYCDHSDWCIAGFKKR